MQYPVTVQGVSLDTLAHKVTTRNGWQSTPGLRAASVEAAHTDGVLVPDRVAPLEPGQIALSMFVRGSDWADYVGNLDTLKRLFSTPRGTVEVTMDTGEGVRVCQARTVASWQPEHVNPLHSRFTVVMEIPAGVWTTADYEVTRREFVNATTPVGVHCGDPTARVTDVQVLVRDPGSIVELLLSDGNVDTVEQQRIWCLIRTLTPIPAGQSLLIDLGQWRATVVYRPDEVDAAWFGEQHWPLADLTHTIVRNGPMFGRSLLPLEPGGVLPPRVPSLRIDPVDVDGIPNTLPEVHVAARAAWL